MTTTENYLIRRILDSLNMLYEIKDGNITIHKILPIVREKTEDGRDVSKVSIEMRNISTETKLKDIFDCILDYEPEELIKES